VGISIRNPKEEIQMYDTWKLLRSRLAESLSTPVKLLAAGLISLVLIAGCSSDDDDAIRIGVIAPLTGGASVFGIASSNGTLLAFEEVNEAGGVMGMEIVPILYDDMHSPVDSVNAYNRLVHDDNVVAIVGPVTSGPASAVASANVTERIPMLAPTATAYAVTTHGDFMFRACFLDAQQAITMAYFARNELNAQTVAILYDMAMDYSTGLAENFRTAFEAMGGEVVAWEAYVSGDVDFRAQLTTIRDVDPDVLFFPDYFTVVALFAAQVAEVGVTATLLGGDGWEGIFNVLDNPALLEGAFYSSHFAFDDPAPIVQNFIRNFTETFGTPPNSFAALGYDAGLIMAQAIEDAGSTDREDIIRALANINFQGATGNITFDAGGNPIKAVVITKIEDGAARLHMRIDP